MQKKGRKCISFENAFENSYKKRQKMQKKTNIFFQIRKIYMQKKVENNISKKRCKKKSRNAKKNLQKKARGCICIKGVTLWVPFGRMSKISGANRFLHFCRVPPGDHDIQFVPVHNAQHLFPDVLTPTQRPRLFSFHTICKI